MAWSIQQFVVMERLFGLPIVAMSRNPPPGAAKKKSTPTPALTIFSATFLQPGCSVLKSFFSASPPCCLPSSRRKRRPGPHVGRARDISNGSLGFECNNWTLYLLVNTRSCRQFCPARLTQRSRSGAVRAPGS